jgi:hypothetical protein
LNFAKLLPGSYQLEVQGFGYNTIEKTIVVGEEDVKLELSVGAAIMISFLLSILLLSQGHSPLATDTGNDHRRSDKPIPVHLQRESGSAQWRFQRICRCGAAAASYAGLTETDEMGRYRLENIAPGRLLHRRRPREYFPLLPGTLRDPQRDYR